MLLISMLTLHTPPPPPFEKSGYTRAFLPDTYGYTQLVTNKMGSPNLLGYSLMDNITSEPVFNITIFRRDIFNGYHLIPYLGLVAPALVLSVLTTLALLLAGDMNKKIRALLINIFFCRNSSLLTTECHFLGLSHSADV